MSTKVESVSDRGGVLARAHRLLEIPSLFDLYQIVADGGKRAPVSRFLDGVPYRTVLDLGCGTGAWSYLTRDRYLGIDYSPSFISGCRKRYGDDPRKSFAVGDVEAIDVNDHFDLALMMSLLHHLSENQAEALLGRLKGRVERILVMDLMPIPSNPLSRLLYRLDRGDFVREADQQRRLLLQSGVWEMEREGSFYSYNHLYRHTLFLLRAADAKDKID